MFKAVNSDFIKDENKKIKNQLDYDYEYLRNKLEKKNINIDNIKDIIKKFQVALPT